MELLKRIKERAPEYNSNLEELIGRFTVIQGGRAGTAKEEELVEQSKYFFTKYEIFIYAFFLGLRKNCRQPFPANAKKVKFIEMKSWHPEITDYIIIGALAKSGIDLFELEKKDDKSIENDILQLKEIIEEYANGGFSIILEKFENQPEYFANNDNCFIDLLQ